MPLAFILISTLLIALCIGLAVALGSRGRAKARAAGGGVVKPPAKPHFLDIDESGGFRGMKSWPELARWASVLPLALFGLLALSWVVRLFIGVFHIGETNGLFLYLLQPLGALLSHMGFVMGGWAAAPRWRVVVAAVLGLALAALNAYALSLGESVLPVIGGAAGVGMGIWLAIRAQRKAVGA